MWPSICSRLHCFLFAFLHSILKKYRVRQIEEDRMTRTIRVLAVDDHPMLREGIAAVLKEEPDMYLAGEAASGADAIESFRLHRPDVTLMDIQMPDMNGIDAIIAIRKEFPDARFIMLTTYLGDAQVARALKAGASGYLLKSMLRKDLLETIRAVDAGKRHVPAEVAAALVDHVAEEALSEREIHVLRKVASGNSNKIIASQLGLSEGTVKSHLKSILSKLGANDRTHAVTIAMRRGFLDG
jgi:DNA-binding NarL/FixJ family response regulator